MVPRSKLPIEIVPPGLYSTEAQASDSFPELLHLVPVRGRARPSRCVWGDALAPRLCARRVHVAPGHVALETPEAATTPMIGASEETKEKQKMSTPAGM